MTLILVCQLESQKNSGMSMTLIDMYLVFLVFIFTVILWYNFELSYVTIVLDLLLDAFQNSNFGMHARVLQ